MKDNRRNFLKLTSLTGLGLAGGVMKGFGEGAEKSPLSTGIVENFSADRFNMSGYAAPKLENVRVGFIGLGMRGPTHLTNMTKLSGVSIMGLCDVREAKVLEA